MIQEYCRVTKLFLWASKWNRKFFVQGYFSITFPFDVGGVTLPVATNHPYLGIEISCDLSWDLQIAAITKKANQIIAFLRRNLGNCPVKEKEKAHFTLVRAHLEYACSVGAFIFVNIFWKLKTFNAGQLAGLNPATTENMG